MLARWLGWTLTLDLVLEILESEAGTRFPHLIELTGSELSAVVSDLNSGKITLALSNAIKSFSPAISNNASVEVVDQGDLTIWTIRDSSYRLSLRYDAMGHEMFLDSYAHQTPDLAESAGPSPEHFNVTAYEALKSAVYPVGLPYDLWNDDARQNLKFSGTPLHALMKLFYRDTGWVIPELGGPGVRHWRSAVEHLGFSAMEVGIIAGTRLGAGESSDPNSGPWNFWGLTQKDLNIGNSIPDPADSIRRIESGFWSNILTERVDILLQQSGLSYEELQQLLDMRFVNTGVNGAPILAIKLGAIDYGSIELLRRQINIDHNITLDTPSGEGEYSVFPNSLSSFVVLASTQDAVTFRFGAFEYSHLSSGLTIAIDVRFVLDGQPLEARRFRTLDHCVISVSGPALTAGTHTISIEARVVRISGNPTEVKTVRVFGAATLEARLETAFKVKSLTCDLSKAKLERLLAQAPGDVEGVLDRMYRFIRLWRKLGWPMPDVDRALLLANAVIDDSIPFEVHGMITDPQGQALAGILVSAVDQDVAGENTLGNATTEELGGYRIVFAASAYRKTASEIGGPDLILRLNDSHVQSLGQSKRLRNASRSTEINLRADVAARKVSHPSAASGNSDADSDVLAAIEWTRNYLIERLGIADQFLEPGRLDTKRYVDFDKAGQPEVPSPYENVFLRPGLTPPPEAFELKARGNEIRGEGKPCTDYVAHIAS